MRGIAEFPPDCTFVDVGAYNGRALRRYIEVGGDVTVGHMVEPNEDMDPRAQMFLFLPLEVHVHRWAAWTSNCVKALYLSRDYAGEGSTLLLNKTTGRVDYSRPIPVPCRDFAAWLLALEGTGPLVVKMNIEGAEYEVLSHMAEVGALDVPRVWYISWHDAKIGRPPGETDMLRHELVTLGYDCIASAVYPATFFEAFVRRGDR
ncbi:MAG: FkbM family methyltransferase [Deltaproteobacteria bacterium]|nr:FkbM family methyltransferase [Deltaproteobacteria bacterium]